MSSRRLFPLFPSRRGPPRVRHSSRISRARSYRPRNYPHNGAIRSRATKKRSPSVRVLLLAFFGNFSVISRVSAPGPGAQPPDKRGASDALLSARRRIGGGGGSKSSRSSCAATVRARLIQTRVNFDDGMTTEDIRWP